MRLGDAALGLLAEPPCAAAPLWRGGGRGNFSAACLTVSLNQGKLKGAPIWRALLSFVLLFSRFVALARRPGHLAAAHHMQVEMVHGLATIFAGIDDDSVAFRK